MMRWLMRAAIFSGMRALIQWWVDWQERKADNAGREERPALRNEARRNGKRMRQTMRMLRRFIRF